MDNEENRILTDADAEAIAQAFKAMFIKQFYQDLGKGVWAMVWRAIMLALIAIAAYGALKSL